MPEFLTVSYARLPHSIINSSDVARLQEAAFALGLAIAMNAEEMCAAAFLKSRFAVEPTYEPLGKKRAPDFSIGRCAFEVRRLNQQFKNPDGTHEGLETAGYQIRRAVEKALSKIEYSPEKGSMFWGVTFNRPLTGIPKAIVKRLAKIARAHYFDQSHTAKFIGASESVSLELIPAAKSYGVAFKYGTFSDLDTFGFVGSIYKDAIKIALSDKIQRTRSIADKFSRWCLVLVDRIDYKRFRDEVGRLNLELGHFNSLIVLDMEGSLLLEWPENSLGRLPSE